MQINQAVDICDGLIVGRKPGMTDEDWLKFKVANSGYTNIKFVNIPVFAGVYSNNSPTRPLDIRIERAAQEADIVFFHELGISESRKFFLDHVWDPSPNLCPWHNERMKKQKQEQLGQVPSLLALSMASLSPYNKAIGMTNGRPHVVSALDNVEGEKHLEAIAKQAKPNDVVTPALAEVLDHVPEAMTLMLHSFGSLESVGKMSPEISTSRCDGMFLGAAAGYFFCPATLLVYDQDGEDVEIVVNPSQKKIHSHHAVMRAFADFIAGHDPIDCPFTKNTKNENYFSIGEKQKDDATYKKWKGKVRTYEIPNEFFIILERISNMTRMLLERGNNISVGMKQSKGGFDKMAERLSLVFGKEWKRRIGDGDFDALDQNIHSAFMNLFYSMALVYFDSKHPDYVYQKRIITYLAKVVSARLVRIFQRLWAILIGSMPSGCWMTSHGDSWIVSLWFFLFCVMQIKLMPLDIAEEAERQLVEKIINIIVYGDDHADSVLRSVIAYWINEKAFAEWCSFYLSVTIRDVRDDVPFVAYPVGGHRGNDSLVYLKHYSVRNRHQGKDQPKYLPYRDIGEYALRAVHGREVKDRDIYDFALSLMGHGYGTYASNYYAYLWLRSAYTACFRQMEDKEAFLGLVLDRSHTNSDFIKKMRQVGISLEDMQKGFPSWASLIEKNAYDPVYHNHFRNDFIPF
jgi:hypothetical protein